MPEKKKKNRQGATKRDCRGKGKSNRGFRGGFFAPGGVKTKQTTEGEKEKKRGKSVESWVLPKNPKPERKNEKKKKKGKKKENVNSP